MNPSKYNMKIIIKQLGNPSVIIADGMEVANYVEFKTVWANKKGLNSRTFYEAMANQSESDVIFSIRNTKGITSDMIIIDSEGTYQIKGRPIDKTGKKLELEIHASIIESR